jgi:hypothetical protein
MRKKQGYVARNETMLGVKVSRTLHQEIRRLADADDRTLSDYCRRVLRAHVQQQNAAQPQ